MNIEMRWRSLGSVIVVAIVAGVASCSSRSQQCEEPQAAPEQEVSADLEPFLTSYFGTWSAGDMDGYRDHFHADATIYLVEKGRVVMGLRRDPFVEGQREVRAGSDHPGVEKMTAFRADEDRDAATVAAEWELVEGDERTVGVDRFTLIRDERWRWKILALVFYSTARGRAERRGPGTPP
jgi:hypothetical protein